MGEIPDTLGPVGSADPNAPNSYTGRLFEVTIDPAASPGDSVTGTYSLNYQVNGGNVQTATQNFVTTVAAVPEPSLCVDMGLLLSSGLLLCRRRRT